MLYTYELAVMLYFIIQYIGLTVRIIYVSDHWYIDDSGDHLTDSNYFVILRYFIPILLICNYVMNCSL